MPWWTGLPTAVAEVDCGGQRHRLVWAEGVLVSFDHGEDRDAEEALAAIGGSPPHCLRILDAWSDIDPLVASEMIDATADDLSRRARRAVVLVDQGRQHMTGSATDRQTAVMVRVLTTSANVLLVVSLGPALARRRALQAIAEISAAGPPLNRALARRRMRNWRQRVGDW